MAKTKTNTSWVNSRQGYLTSTVVLFLASYGTASLAIDSGSLIAYFLTLVLFGIAVNRLAKAIRGR